jgi:hypothetical protein
MCPYPIIPRYRSLLVVGVTDDNVERDGWSGSYSRHHDQQLQARTDERSDVRRNTLRTFADARHRGRTRGDVRNAKRIDTSPYTYAAKHVVSYTVGVSISSSLHASISDAIIIPRFDMTVGAIFSPKMGLRVPTDRPGVAKRYIHFVVRRAALHERTCVQEDGTVRHRTRHSGYVEDLTGRGSPSPRPELSFRIRWRALIAACKQLPKEYRSRSFLCGNHNVR